MAEKVKSAKDVRIVIIGAGMAGILTGIRLDEYGYRDYVIYEKSDRLGGTWRENTYPGLACDVPAHLYTYSFEPNPDWTHFFAPGPEIQAYFEKVADKYNIVEKIRFNKEIESCEFKNGRWVISMADGSNDEADVVIAASGVLHHPNTAQLPGLDSFSGTCFHTARWDHSVELEGKRVGVVGTGSTAIQITSALVDKVSHFSLFQRTPQWIMPIEDSEYSEIERARYREHPEAIEALRAELDRKFQVFANAVIDSESSEMKEIEQACLDNLETNVYDAKLREALRPDYRAACKRLIFSPDFYDAIQHPNAELVTAGIDQVEAGGIRTADGKLHELDVLVMATGFRADRFIRPATVLGRGGVNLDDVWSDHPVAFLSISIPDFPNFFMLNGPNGPVGNFSLIQIAESQVSYVLQLIGQIRAGECREISATAKATEDFEVARAVAAKQSIWATGCKSWYLDKHGVPASWPWTPSRFFEEMASPNLEQFDRVG